MVQKKKSGPEKARKRLMRLAFRQTHLYRFVNMVRPTGFEPAAFRVGVIRPSSREPLWHNGLVGIAQISTIFKKNLGSLVGQGFRDFSR